MAAAALIAVILLIEKPVYTFAGLFIVLLGIPVFHLQQRLEALAVRA